MIKIENCDLNLDDTITCGQCFRFYKLNDNSYDIIIRDRVINVRMDKSTMIVESNNEDNLLDIVKEYFDLNKDYSIIRKKVILLDDKLKEVVKLSKGLRILKQDPLEMIISYIISANNKVERISKSINLLCERYGEEIIFNNKKYYLFPNINKLRELSIDQLNNLKIGFRDKYVYDAINKLYNKEINISEIYNKSSDDALNYLMSINGVGPKVASCILMFAYNRFDVFPVDTWATKQICTIHNDVKPNQKDVIKFAKEKYKNMSGIALQFMFHSLRNKKN